MTLITIRNPPRNGFGLIIYTGIKVQVWDEWAHN
jgi:hypothetical protein